jgi:hypothetical protein
MVPCSERALHELNTRNNVVLCNPTAGINNRQLEYRHGASGAQYLGQHTSPRGSKRKERRPLLEDEPRNVSHGEKQTGPTDAVTHRDEATAAREVILEPKAPRSDVRNARELRCFTGVLRYFRILVHPAFGTVASDIVTQL